MENIVSAFLWTFKKPTVSDVTFEWYLGIAKTHVIPALGHIPAGTLTSVQIQKLLYRMHSERQLSIKTVKVVRDVLNQAYRHAVEMKLLVTNPVSGTKLPKYSRIKTEQAENAKAIPSECQN